MMSRNPAAPNKGSNTFKKSTTYSVGQKSSVNSEISDDAVELNRFLAGLSQHTKATGVPHNFSDISISSDEDFKGADSGADSGGGTMHTATSAGSKFLKTKPSTSAQVKYSTSFPVKSAFIAQSPALNRLSQHTQNLMKKANIPTSPSIAETTCFSQESTIESEAIGTKGSKFLKSKQAKYSTQHKTPTPAHSAGTSTEYDSDIAAYMQGLSASITEISDNKNMGKLSKDTDKVNTEVTGSTHNDDSSFATETFSSRSLVDQKYSMSEQDDSEIQTVSEGAPETNVMDISTLSLGDDTLVKSKNSYHLVSPAKISISSPFYPANEDGITSRHSELKDISKCEKQSIIDAISLKTVDDLLIAQLSTVKLESSRKSSKKISEKVSDPKSSSISTYNGSPKTQSIDSEIKTISTSTIISENYDSDFDDTVLETDSIHTNSGSLSRNSSHYRSCTSSPVGSGESSKSNSLSCSSSSLDYKSSFHSTSKLCSDSRSPAMSHSRSRSSSVSSSYSRSSSQSKRTLRSKSNSRSCSPFLSSSNASTTYSSFSYHSNSFEDTSEVDAPHTFSLRKSLSCADAGVQTGIDLEEIILRYCWTSDSAGPSNLSGPCAKQVLKPAEVSKLAVDNDALAVLTTFNPALLALNDMMRQQVDLSKQFLSLQNNLHKSVLESIEKEHIYTTMAETKQFIESRRQPKLTFEQALAMVKEEMGLQL